MTADEVNVSTVEKMRELCMTRPVIYSDQDHLKKGSTAFLHDRGYSDEEIAAALSLDLREVEANLKGTGFVLDLRKVERFRNAIPSNIGDIISIRIPALNPGDRPVLACVRVVQYILRGDSCGLVVELQEDIETDYPLFGSKKRDDEAVIPLEWYVR